MHTAADEADVRAATQAWIDAFNHADLTAIGALYDPHAVLWGTTSPQLIRTAEGIAAYFAAVFALQPAPRMVLGEAVVRQWGDVAVSTGGYLLTWPDATARRVPARFSFVYHRSAAGWRIVDHHSSAMPDPQAVLAAASR
ncbi:MAG: DUF3225 domain-containing protein [Hydrogenophaga sp.]|jgi:uncharacterized protein (TIGR02246 family)|uniref:nuclear transport factor 2 family protein n=1 Tax=Hydrogenophaga sp. TaxID=1904254 RepID=UPI001D901324|nr:nuclear transport factor 2 family protein [Hydrogenophaga sp.]MBW0171652.1 DUF3225 domain-containing protein [Hydrogenophaga sp.]MBW0184158.1 DUF3225 domain-containing protein [Hydrogenophaga sp.]